MKTKDFVFLITGCLDNSALAENYAKATLNCKTVQQYKLSYVAPYTAFDGIDKFETTVTYRPFKDVASRKAAVIIDLYEWISHETEEYLEIFFKYLSDYDGFFHHRYLFTVGNAKAEQVGTLNELAANYLGRGKLIELNPFIDLASTASYLTSNYPFSPAVAEIVAGIVMQKPIRGASQLDNFLRDFVSRISVAGEQITLTELKSAVGLLSGTKLGCIYDISELITLLTEEKERAA